MKKVLSSILIVVLNVSVAAGQNVYKPKKDRMLWDTFVGFKAGAMYANLTSLKGKEMIMPTGGMFAELFVNRSLSVELDMMYSQQGSKETVSLRGSDNGQLYDYKFEYLNMDCLLKGYLADWLSFYTGVHMAGAISMKRNGTKINKNELYSGDVAVPVGLSFVCKNISLDARYYYPLRKVARSAAAKEIMGNAKNMGIVVTLGYRIPVF